MTSVLGHATSIVFDPGRLKPLVLSQQADTYIVATEDGFSPLGRERSFLATELGIPEGEIRNLANWNRFHNQNVSLIALRSRRKGSILRGVILAASETSESYRRFAVPIYGRPYRDFFYNVTYEAIAHAHNRWGARRIALAHLSGGSHFHADIATCNVEALAHFCDQQSEGSIESLIFLGCCIAEKDLLEISRLNSERDKNRHRPIELEIESFGGYEIINIRWWFFEKM